VFARKLLQEQCEYAPYTLHTNFRAVAVQPQGLHFSATGGTGTRAEGAVHGHEDRADGLPVLWFRTRYTCGRDTPISSQGLPHTRRHLRRDLRIHRSVLGQQGGVHTK
jgi:hypothetical protein